MQKNCSNCGQEFHCGALEQAACETKSLECWCAELPTLAVVATKKDCLCPTCLTAAIAEVSTANQAAPSLKD